MFYWLAPRVWNRPLHSVSMATTHFWLATVGIVLYIVALWTAGVTQGLMLRATTEDGLLQNPNFLDTTVLLIPFYWIRLLGGTMYLTGLCLMAWNLFRTANPGAGAQRSAPAMEIA